MTPHRGPSRQGIAATGRWPLPSGPRRGHSRHPVRLPSGCRRTCLRDGRLAKADGARVVALRPHHPVPARKGPRPPVRPRGVVAPLPLGPPATSPAATPGCDPKADARVVGAGAPLHPGAARLAGRHPGRPADLPPRLAARHPPTILRHPRHAARAMPARVRQAVPARGSRPSRTAQPPLCAPVAGREPPSRKDDRGGTTAGTTGIKATTTDSKAKPPNDPILQLRHKSAAQPAPRPLPAGVP